MASSWSFGKRLRDAWRATGEAAPEHGVCAAAGIAGPLVTGVLTGHPVQASMAGLGGYLAALAAPVGDPYRVRAVMLGRAVVLVTAGAALGDAMHRFPWAAVVVVPLVMAAQSLIPSLGLTGGTAVLLFTLRPGYGVPAEAGYAALGASWASLLYLMPWPVRRLQPLRRATATQAQAMAAAVEQAGCTPGGGWDEAVRRAVRVSGEARDTYRQYRNVRGQPTRAQELIDAISMLTGHAVALRTLFAAMPGGADAAFCGWVGGATRDLAGWLRQLGAALGGGSEAVPPVPRVPPPAGPAEPGGERDPVAAALADRITREVAALVATAARVQAIAAAGLQIKVAPGPLPDPGTMWRQAKGSILTGHPQRRQAGRIGVALGASMALTTALRVPHQQWMAMTVVSSLRDTYGQTIDRVLERVGGTILGAVVAALLLALVPGQLTAAGLVAVCALAAFTLRPLGFAYWTMLLTPMTMMLLDFAVPASWAEAGDRIVLTLAGGFAALAAARLLWPASPSDELPALLAALARAHARLLRVVVDAAEHQAWRAALEAARHAARAVRKSRDIHRQEPAHDQDRIDALEHCLQACAQIRQQAIAIRRLARTPSAVTGVPGLPAPAEPLLGQIAASLGRVGAAIAAGDRAPTTGSLDEPFSELDEHVSALTTRARQGTNPDHAPPLAQAAALRTAFRSLRQSIRDLTTATTRALA